ncbi:MAG: S26 family signal peptidase [Candidatus Hydrothermarchaeales archaeon]
MAFQFQYQYQYQYGYQVQPGYQTYLSFFQMLHDVPFRPVLLSVAIALIPFVLYYLKKKGYVLPLWRGCTSIFTYLYRRFQRKDMDRRVRDEYTFLLEKKTELRDVIRSSSYLGLMLIGIAILKHMLFFGLVLSNSMVPTLYAVDIVLLEGFSRDFEAGDIVMFTPPTGVNPVIHRISSISNEYIRTAGDFGGLDEWTLTRENIVGKAVMINGKPVVVKNIGWYFMPYKTYMPGMDPMFDFVREGLMFVHEYGPLIIVVLVLFALVTNFESRKYARIYEA